MRQAGPGGEEGAVEMDRQHPAPLGEAEILQQVHDLDAGVADQDVDPAPGPRHPLDPGIHLAFVGHVHGDGHDLRPLPAELGRGGLGGGLRQIGDGDLRSLPREGGGDRLADAAGGAGDDRDGARHHRHSAAAVRNGVPFVARDRTSTEPLSILPNR